MESFCFTRLNSLYAEGFDDYVITEMINMLYEIKKKSNAKLRTCFNSLIERHTSTS